MKIYLRYLFALLAMLLSISACGKKYTEDELKQIVTETDKKLTTLAGQPFDWGSQKAFSKVMAYYPEPDIIFINENLKYRKRGQALNLYYFKDGYLIHFKEKQLLYLRKKDSKLSKELTHLNMFLEPGGEVLSYEKTINFKDAKITDDELTEVINHAQELYKLVGDKPSD